MIPEDFDRTLREALESGADVSLSYREGGTETFEGSSTGAGQYAVGDNVRLTVEGIPMVLDAGVGRVEGGGFAGTFRGEAVTLDQATPIVAGAGVVFLAAAAFFVYRKSIHPAIVCGGFGVGLIAGAFYPPLFAIALLALIAGVVWYFRDSVALTNARRALGAVVGEVETIGEVSPTTGAGIRANMSRRLANDGPAKREIKRAKGARA